MIQPTISFTAYGSLMLLGEYGVVEGGWGVCAAVNQSLAAYLTKRSDNQIFVRSDFGTMTGTIFEPPSSLPLRYISAALAHYQPYYQSGLNSGFELELTSEINPILGLGSSAACLVATVGVLHQAFLAQPQETSKDLESVDLKLIENSVLKILSRLSPLASGCDCLASLYGGVVAFRPSTEERKFIPSAWPFQVVYVGYKTETAVMLEFVQQQKSLFPQHVKETLGKVHQLTEEGILALQQQDWLKFGNIMNQHQHWQRALGTSDQTIEQVITLLQDSMTRIEGIKISGSGRGDCLIILPSLPKSSYLNLAEVLITPAKEVEVQLQPGRFKD